MKKITLYKVKNYDNLYLDKHGKPYLVNPKTIVYRKVGEKREQYLSSQINGKSRLEPLKRLVAKTLLNKNGKYIGYKDGNPKNCTPNNLIISNKAIKTGNEYFTCKRCKKRIRKHLDNYIKGYCSKCARQNKKQEHINTEKEKYKKFGNYLANNMQFINLKPNCTNRKIIIDKLKQGKNYSKISKELKVSRQAIHSTVNLMIKNIRKNKNDKK